METRARHQSRQAFHELQRLHDDMGGAVFGGTLQLQYDLAGTVMAQEAKVTSLMSKDLTENPGR